MNEVTIHASSGKVFRRIADGMIYGSEVTLGYTYYINGVPLKEPHLDTVSDFEEVSIDEINSTLG